MPPREFDGEEGRGKKGLFFFFVFFVAATQTKMDALVVHDSRRTDELVDVRIPFPLQLSHIPLRVLHDRAHPGADAATHVPDRLEARHLVADGRFAREQVVLVRPQPLAVQPHRLRERRQLRAQL